MDVLSCHQPLRFSTFGVDLGVALVGFTFFATGSGSATTATKGSIGAPGGNLRY